LRAAISSCRQRPLLSWLRSSATGEMQRRERRCTLPSGIEPAKKLSPIGQLQNLL
jgi:hypothetical protein